MDEIRVKTEMLLDAMKKKKISQERLADAIGCQTCTMNYKLHNKTPITVDEMAIILRVLEITDSDTVFEICNFRKDL